jgi:hypothetical protein
MQERNTPRRRVIGTIALTLLTLAIVGSLGVGIYQAGYEHGLIGSTSEIAVTPRAIGPYYGGIALVFKALFAFLFLGFIAKVFFFRRMHHSGDWRGRREEFRSRMDEHLTEWHTKVHGGNDDEAPTTA